MIIGLTGGIASGKSTVSRYLKEWNIPVCDADIAARQVVEKGTDALRQIVAVFGDEVLTSTGELDRKKLGSIIFNCAEKRQQLNAIVHPAVRAQLKKEAESYLAQGYPHVVMDIPLLFESKLTHMVDVTLLIYVAEDVQLARLIERDHSTKEEATARIASQLPLAQKKKWADAVVDNNGSEEELWENVRQQLIKWDVL
ncbi:dephospho-CoA kinase [Fictibacillus macauensis ZFHKF-1]|uniref:Dephospho-CoA kinase n=2 Tax=Fictibacillus TaxID=1329200 RepID=I8J0Z1_9BACL|nr:dephospho-CoA kinase [Fictibacillus macauensis ZFHKF-1]